MKDLNGTLLRGSIADNQFRLFACETTAIVQHIRDIHNLFPLPSILMGRLITAVALMSSELKAPRSEVSIRVDAEGPLKGGIVIANKEGMLKGYAFVPQLWLPENRDNLLVGKALDKGTFTVIRQSGLKAPYEGKIELFTGEIGHDLAQYYLQSEQLPTAVNLGVLIDKDARIRAAGGILIQALPQADKKLVAQIEENIMNTPNVSDLMDMGLTIEQILDIFVLTELPWQISKTTPIKFQCDCSKERFARGLLLLGKEELQGLREEISPVCHYCNATYTFSKDEIEELIKSLD